MGKILFESDSIRVCEEMDADGDLQRLLFLGPPFNFTQGAIKTENPKFHVGEPSKNMTYGALCVPGGVRSALILGLGAGITIQAIRDLFPDAAIDIVDYNRAMFHVSNNYFFNIMAKNLILICSDAHAFVKRVEKKYDYICCDIWGNQLEVPEGLLKGGGFFSDLKRILAGRGVLAINTHPLVHKYVSEVAVSHFKHLLWLKSLNSALIASDSRFGRITDPDLISKLAAINIDIKTIESGLTVMSSAADVPESFWREEKPYSLPA